MFLCAWLFGACSQNVLVFFPVMKLSLAFMVFLYCARWHHHVSWANFHFVVPEGTTALSVAVPRALQFHVRP